MTHIRNHTLPEGAQLGVYEIKEVLKTDTFVIAYRAWNDHVKEWVVIQEYFPHDFAIRANDGFGVESKSPSDRENFDYGLKAFLDQAETLTQIEHPNIVKAENVLQFNGTAYLIMGYQEGVTLSKLVQSPATIAETELKFILVSILNALQKIHEYKIVHGGIQPTTIILGKDGEPLLTDFTGARLSIATHTAKLADILTPGYAAPELYGHANGAGATSDIYALGATMYYCITHKQATDAQSRMMALSKGEHDPVASLSGSHAAAAYSAELLQAIDWMLRPEYNERPHSATEILAFLKAGPIDDQAGQKTSKQDSKEITDSQAVAKNPVWIGVMVGIVGLVIVGLWLGGKKPSEISGDKVSITTAQPLAQGNSGKSIVTQPIKENQSAVLSTTQSSQEPDPNKISGHTIKDTNESEKQPKQTDEEMRLKTSTDGKPPKNGMEKESKPISASKPVSNPQPGNTISHKKESESGQKIAVIEKSLHRPKKQKLTPNPTHEGSINGYLASAKKAMKEVRFTTPAGNNAYEYYQKVLAKKPGNAEALAGMQKIVDRYAGFIRKSRAEGKLDTAKRALKKAESVLPNDPKLQRIREELAVTID